MSSRIGIFLKNQLPLRAPQQSSIVIGDALQSASPTAAGAGIVKKKKSLKKNALTVLALRGISMVCSYVMIPLMIDYLDTYRFGIWVTISSIVTWINFFDIGLGNGLRNKFAQSIAKDEIKQAKRYVSTAYFLVSLISAVLLLLFLLSFTVIKWYKVFNVQPAIANELNTTILIAFGFQIVSFSLKLITSMLNGAQKSGVANSFGPIANVISLLVVYFFVSKTGSNNLIRVAFIYTATPVIIVFLVTLYYFSTKFKAVRPNIRYIQKKYIKDITGLGVKFFVLQICALILVSTTPLIIANALGQHDVTQYNVMFRLYNIPYMIFYLLLTPFWSAFTDAYTRQDLRWIKAKLKQLFRMWLVVVISLITILVFNKFLFHIWVGDRIKVNNTTGLYFILYFMVYAAMLPLAHFINGIGKVRIQLYIYLIVTVINIPLSFILAKPLGIDGPIITNIICLLPLVTGMGVQTYKILKGRATGLWNK